MPPLPDGWHILRFAVLAGSRLAVIGANADIHGAWRSDFNQTTVGAALRATAKATARVWILGGDDLSLTESIEFPLLQQFPLVDQFPDGRWVVANARSEGQGNARILGASGEEERRFELGDGIEHIKIDNQSRIWIGWFDEGVFGNEGWRMPDRRWPPSVHGMAAFDDRGALLMHARSKSVADCYALNVSGNTAWACTYTDFPIWRINNDEERTWPTYISGTRALAVSYPYVLAAGGYQENANRVVLLRLNGQSAKAAGEWRLPFGVGYPDNVSLVDGRDGELHVVHDQQWHRWHIRTFIKGHD